MNASPSLVSRGTRAVLLGACLAAAPLGMAQAQDDTTEVRFSVPPWPGVTVKTELAAQLLETLGYKPQQEQLGTTITYQALNENELDAFLAGWLPAQQGMYDTAMEKGTLVDLGNNVDGARIGFAVPRYVAEAGVTSAEDLDTPENAERFGRTVYSIETGTGMSEQLNAGVDSDTYGLGDWELSETSTPGMLGAADSAINNQEWIVFAGWTPHWMNIKYDLAYLDDPKDLWGEDGGRSDVRTLVTKEFSEAHPNATKLLDQLDFTADDQSDMIRRYDQDEMPKDEAAIAWMRDNADKVEGFLDGVTTRDGEPAWPVVKEAFDL
ncbi:glycine/betaine ABC transporter [Chromohalobacter japonicus]|uniref:Glycine/betaine ABC transporter n=3 Tax=Chromohalobacter TaxID=42054 RepID=A0A1Q8T8Z9_9GAMM|nr:MULTISPECIES: ABC transporter substrate-binding protein [Chromohalobacter]MCK2043184.1 ABC transporter substrate-binding protein [Chromohalobacter moromii]MCK2046167.1 ABC transporter substrate-binding protein [Chromohalobacter moromii]MCT8505409.1 ABC transporter substrate-binding protein [Chromohalobacter moromii]MCT8515580.1 ABC transporter substrate-binding protein [Chromohalobacter sp. TMW 2.2271]OLO10147.1 glycine/betaine ABC transporter [Chromohalobacter japonicus]